MAQKTGTQKRPKTARALFTLPAPLMDEVERYADLMRGGNKSGFVADAVRSYIDRIRKAHHTAKLRESYAAAARQSLEISEEWQPLDEELSAKLDELEGKQ